jgi:hypothetical protein
MKRGAKRRERAPVPSPLTRPQWLVVLGLGAVIIGLGVSYPLYDPDLWQHLRVGRAIWETHSIPRTNVWTWPTYGEPYTLPSWLFRVVLWPFYAIGGVWGLMAWRWGATLATFAIAGATARRMGARGLAVVVAIVWCALLFRQRSMVRPETLAYLLLAAQMWILETRRRGGSDRSAALVPIAWIWANAHATYYLSLAITGFHVLDEFLATWRGKPKARPPARLAGILLASGAIGFVNPFGWATLWQPIRYYLDSRHQALLQMIMELRPIVWQAHVLDGLPVWMLLAAGLCVLRIVRRRGDLVDSLVYALFFASALNSQRFLGFLTVAAAPIFARDVAELVHGIPVPVALRPAWPRVACAALVLVLGAAPQLTVEPWRPGFGIAWKTLPVRACDWIERHDIRGRSFSAFHHSGYMLWRFWPQRDRLPFMDIHQTGTPADRELYGACWSSEAAWRTLDSKYRFDYVLLPRTPLAGQDLLDRMDADSAWSLVFVDDVAALYLRREGRFARLAAREMYRIVPAGGRAVPRMAAASTQGPDGRQRLRSELERQARESEWASRAYAYLATLDLLEKRWAEALEHLERALAIEPDVPLLREQVRVARDSLAAARR